MIPKLQRTPMTSRIATKASLCGLLLILSLGSPPAAAAQDDDGPSDLSSRPASAEEWTTLEERPGEGEQCLVCGNAIVGEEIVEIRHRGRTFHVARKMLGEFETDPDLYFRKIQARAALFDEEAMHQAPLAGGWLIFGLYVLVGLLFAALCAYLAVGWGKAPLPWFFAGLLANVPAFVALLVTRGSIVGMPSGASSVAAVPIPPGLAKVPTTRAPVPCPACGASNHPSAPVCGVCGSGLDPSVEAETARV